MEVVEAIQPCRRPPRQDLVWLLPQVFGRPQHVQRTVRFVHGLHYFVDSLPLWARGAPRPGSRRTGSHARGAGASRESLMRREAVDQVHDEFVDLVVAEGEPCADGLPKQQIVRVLIRGPIQHPTWWWSRLMSWGERDQK